MEKNSFVFIAVCIVFYLGYSQYLNKKYPDRLKPQVSEEPSFQPPTGVDADRIVGPGDASHIEPPTRVTPVASTQVDLLPSSQLTLENDDVQYVFSQKSGGMDHIVLKNYRSDDGSEEFQLLNHPLAIRAYVDNTTSDQLFEGLREGDRLILQKTEDQWLIRQEYVLPENGYGLEMTFSWQNISDKSRELKSRVSVISDIAYATASQGVLGFLPGIPTARPTIIGGFSGSVDREDVQHYCEDTSKLGPILSGNGREVDYFGFDRHYFLIAMIPQIKKASLDVQKVGKRSMDSCPLRIQTAVDQGRIEPGQVASLRYRSWFGPKSDTAMSAYDATLASSVDLGFFSTVGQLLLGVLRWVYGLVGNWGIAIVIFTILLKFAFYPLTRAAHVSMGKMRKLQPQMTALKEKYKDDPKRQQQELMQFMAANKVNPMKGCLPILPQIPVFFAFYRVLSSSVELRQAPFIGWITDLSVADPYYITPVLLGIGMFLQQKLTPTPGMDKTQERIMMMLPVVFGVMMITLPAGLVLYMLTNTIVSIGQQQWLNRKLA